MRELAEDAELERLWGNGEVSKCIVEALQKWITIARKIENGNDDEHDD